MSKKSAKGGPAPPVRRSPRFEKGSTVPAPEDSPEDSPEAGGSRRTAGETTPPETRETEAPPPRKVRRSARGKPGATVSAAPSGTDATPADPPAKKPRARRPNPMSPIPDEPASGDDAAPVADAPAVPKRTKKSRKQSGKAPAAPAVDVPAAEAPAPPASSAKSTKSRKQSKKAKKSSKESKAKEKAAARKKGYVDFHDPLAKKTKKKPSWSIYIYKVLKQVADGATISRFSMQVMNSIVQQLFENIADEALRVTKIAKKRRVTTREIQTATRLVCSKSPDLSKHVVAQGTLAVTKVTSQPAEEPSPPEPLRPPRSPSVPRRPARSPSEPRRPARSPPATMTGRRQGQTSSPTRSRETSPGTSPAFSPPHDLSFSPPISPLRVDSSSPTSPESPAKKTKKKQTPSAAEEEKDDPAADSARPATRRPTRAEVFRLARHEAEQRKRAAIAGSAEAASTKSTPPAAAASPTPTAGKGKKATSPSTLAPTADEAPAKDTTPASPQGASPTKRAKRTRRPETEPTAPVGPVVDNEETIGPRRSSRVRRKPAP